MHCLFASLVLTVFSVTSAKRPSEIWFSEEVRNLNLDSPLHAAPHTYLNATALPESFDWHDVNGTSYVTHSLNQHIPQYCGSCWAHGAVSALADRVKIARRARGSDINFSIQSILNCGAKTAGSCHGGSALGAYKFISDQGFIPYDTCQPYLACSAESSEGFCPHVDTTCSAYNTCRTCSTFDAMGGHCEKIAEVPGARIKDYGRVIGEDNIAAEIYARGPVACGINAGPALNYTTGIFDDIHASRDVDHIISVTGWGYDSSTGKQYWNVRNSWGQYWGELGYMYVFS